MGTSLPNKGPPLNQRGVHSWRASGVSLCSDTLRWADLADPGPALPGRENPGPSDLLSFTLQLSVPQLHHHYASSAGEELPPRNVVRINELIHVKTLE